MKRVVLILAICLIEVSVYAPIPPRPSATPPWQGEKIETFLSSAPLTRTNLQLALELNGIVAPAVVMAQSRLETGNYQSRLCLEDNNLFGMNFPRVRPTTAAGSTEYGFAWYHCWYDSVRDMKLFQEWYIGRGWNIEAQGTGHGAQGEEMQYLIFLAAIGYAEDLEYLPKLLLLCTI